MPEVIGGFLAALIERLGGFLTGLAVAGYFHFKTARRIDALHAAVIVRAEKNDAMRQETISILRAEVERLQDELTRTRHEYHTKIQRLLEDDE